MPRLLNQPRTLLDARRNYEVFDDFTGYGSGETIWTNLAADAGVTAFAEGDFEYGRARGATGATDNNEVMARSTNEVALFQADGTFIYEARIAFTEANTDDANVAVGLADAAGANLLLDDGGGDSINDSGALIFKIDGGTVWRAACEIANANTTETASQQTAGGAAYQTLTIEGRDVDGTNFEFTYFLNQEPLTDTNNNEIRHLIAFASATEMRLVAGYVKAGGANSETLDLDYCYYRALRI